MEEKQLTKKEKVKKVWNENKGLILGVGALVGGTLVAIGTAVVAGKRIDNMVPDSETIKDTTDVVKNVTDYGRDCLMTFAVEENGDIITKVKTNGVDKDLVFGADEFSKIIQELESYDEFMSCD